jgi:hypothetical protein
MKHAIYILLAALALLLASCKKKHHDDIPQLNQAAGWREIGMTGVATIWYPDSVKRLLLFENKRYYKQINQDTVTARGTYELVTVDEYWTHKKMQGIRFSGDHVTYTLQMRHDTLVIANNDGALDVYVRYYKSVPTM